MKTPRIGQIVIPPDQADAKIVLAAVKIASTAEKLPWSITAKVWVSEILHPFGIHHWVQYKTFDAGSGRIIEWPDRWVCQWCPRGKIE